MSSAPLKLGLLGAGMISTYSYGYLPNLHRIASKAVLSAVADPVVDGTFSVNAAKSPRTEIFGRTGTINLPDYDYLGGDSTIPFELFRLDALAGVDGWITPNARSIRQAQQHFDQLARTSVIEHLVDCVRTGEKPTLSAEPARHTLEIMLAARESATAGRAIVRRTAF
jgi:predicted dehydrogenase